MKKVILYKRMFTKEELQIIKAIFSSDITLPVSVAELVVSIKNKVAEQLNDNKNESAENVSGAQN